MSKTCVLLFSAAFISLAWAPEVRAGEFEPFIPENTKNLIYINWGQITRSPLFVKHFSRPLAAAMEDDQDLKKHLEALGIDLMKGVDYMLCTDPVVERSDTTDSRFLYAGGVAAISRWLNAATPPIRDFFTPEALQQLAGG